MYLSFQHCSRNLGTRSQYYVHTMAPAHVSEPMRVSRTYGTPRHNDAVAQHSSTQLQPHKNSLQATSWFAQFHTSWTVSYVLDSFIRLGQFHTSWTVSYVLDSFTSSWTVSYVLGSFILSWKFAYMSYTVPFVLESFLPPRILDSLNNKYL